MSHVNESSPTEKGPLEEHEPDNATHQAHPAYVATGTGFLLGLWKPGQTLTTDVPQTLRDQVSLSAEDFISLVVLTVITLIARLWNISNPPEVVHEEAIIGSRINNYMTGRFFYDAQPPLVPMIYYYVANSLGYPGQFDFSRFNSYIGHVYPYFELRLFSALLGVAVVILTFLTLKLTGMGRRSATVGAIMVAFESSFVIQHRYIFAEPVSLFFLAVAVYLWKLLELQQPLGLKWHAVASLLGLTLGALVSSKTEGWYTVIGVFLASSYQLWWSFGDIKQRFPFVRFTFNAGFRAFYFYFIPYLFLAITTAVHLNMLPGTGEGTPFVSGQFQSSFINFPNEKVVSPVGIGSFISLRHVKTNVYLHSHDEFYKSGSRQQQVTGYGYRDLNNIWFVENVSVSAGNPHTEPFRPLSNEAYIKLKHLQSGRRLHTHDQRAPVTDNDYQYEVTAYGADGYPGDLNDLWQLEIVSTEPREGSSQKEWRALDTIVRLKHPLKKCYLFSHKVKLPIIGQQEITCANNGIDVNSYWYVETNYHPQHANVPDLPRVKYGVLSLMDRVNEYRDLMASTFEYLEKEKSNTYTHKGWLLPFLKQSIVIYRNHHRQVAVIGNFVVWYSVLGGLATYAAFKVYTLLALQAGWRDFSAMSGIKEMDHHVGGFILLWFCHYFPFLFKDNTSLQEYLPALYFSILAAAKWLDYSSLLVFRRPKIVSLFYALLMALTISSFIFYSPFVYGTRMLSGQCKYLEFNNNQLWYLSCNTYLDTPEQYAEYDSQFANEINYHYEAPKDEEHIKATVVTTVDKANPTEFAFQKEKKNTGGENGADVRRFLKKYKKETKNSFVNIVNKDDKNDVVGIDASTDTKEDPEEDDIDKLDPEVESQLVIQWARITDSPSLVVDSQVAASAKSELEKKSQKSEEPSPNEE
ncbi:hypothetical protein DV451_002018 [Geotrichum candidum]|uniref:Dolichyl-phosphate-mannose--protein mannosyltransferase n=1 Tax=Geotrichum candidum TaxID=1173061 RepID=A0A9P5G7M9_GEOCN|nr:hypothetical protein DV451_002018 [Geotrichum candidum]KAF5109684.1 hypothetical protein DV453_001290 [Geotrichum candidum]